MAYRRPDNSEINGAARQSRARQAVHQVTGGSPDLMDMLAQLDDQAPEHEGSPSEQRSEGTPSGELPEGPYGQVVERSTTHLGWLYVSPNSNTGDKSDPWSLLQSYVSGGC